MAALAAAKTQQRLNAGGGSNLNKRINGKALPRWRGVKAGCMPS